MRHGFVFTMARMIPVVRHRFEEIADELDQHGDREDAQEGRHLILDEHAGAAGLGDLEIRDRAVDDRLLAVETDPDDDPGCGHAQQDGAEGVDVAARGLAEAGIENVDPDMPLVEQRVGRSEEEQRSVPVAHQVAHQRLFV